MKSFIKACEYWLPNADGTLLQYGGGLYAPDSHMGRISHDTRFARGDGLPGLAWSEGAPVVLHSFGGSIFKRTEAAHADGLTCGIAVPIFHGEVLGAVVVFFCGDDESSAGAIEIWRNDPEQSKDMLLADGHYGQTGDTFEFVSRRTAFRIGTGLPGMVWQQRRPIFLRDLGRSAGFLRGDSAVKVGITRGFAMPCATAGKSQYVLAFLSALGTPIAARVEIWLPNAAGTGLTLRDGFCEASGPLNELDTTVEPGQGSVGQCWLTGLPIMSTSLDNEPGGASRVSGLSSVCVLPVLHHGQLTAALAMYF